MLPLGGMLSDLGQIFPPLQMALGSVVSLWTNSCQKTLAQEVKGQDLHSSQFPSLYFELWVPEKGAAAFFGALDQTAISWWALHLWLAVQRHSQIKYITDACKLPFTVLSIIFWQELKGLQSLVLLQERQFLVHGTRLGGKYPTET